MNAPRTRGIRTRRQRGSGRATVLGTAAAVILGFAGLAPAHAAQSLLAAAAGQAPNPRTTSGGT